MALGKDKGTCRKTTQIYHSLAHNCNRRFLGMLIQIEVLCHLENRLTLFLGHKDRTFLLRVHNAVFSGVFHRRTAVKIVVLPGGIPFYRDPATMASVLATSSQVIFWVGFNSFPNRWTIRFYNKDPPAKPGVFHMRAKPFVPR